MLFIVLDLHKFVSTMICIAVKGVPKFGVIHFPYSKKTYWGHVDSKVFSDNLKPSERKTPPENSFIVSRSHKGKNIGKIIQAGFENTATIEGAGGAGYKVIYVIMGNASVYTHINSIKKWDICAGLYKLAFIQKIK